jgi:uncharacterized phiE125 gp8 family phage protein
MGSLSLVTAPGQEPISLQEAKEHCRIDLADEDARISSYIIAERQHVERATGRQLITAAWVLKLDGWPCWIDVPKPPLRSVTTVQYVDTAGVTQTLAADQYRVVGATGGTVTTLVRGRITPAYGVTWPTVQCVEENVIVTFSAGFGASGDSVPTDLLSGILMRVQCAYLRRGMTDDERRTYRGYIEPYKSRPVTRQ